MVPWASLQFVIEAVPDHTHVLFLYYKFKNIQGDFFSVKNSLNRPGVSRNNIGHNSEVP